MNDEKAESMVCDDCGNADAVTECEDCGKPLCEDCGPFCQSCQEE